MKKLFVTALLVSTSATILFAQKTKEQQEVLKVNEAYEEAMRKGDYDAQEKFLAPGYVAYHPDGSFEGRAQVAEWFRKQKTNPTFKMVGMKSDDVTVRVSGNLAVVSGGWKATTQRTDPDAEPHDDAGRYTAVYEKQNGKWLVVFDHVTEKPHTPEEMEPSLRKASEAYDRALKTRDAALYDKLLAEDYMYTNEKGDQRNKAEDIKHMASPDLVLTSANATDKKFRIYRNAAVETGRYEVAGTYKGTPFTEAGRYTTTWIYKDGRWQIVADHTSTVPQATTMASKN